jgi:hypothetical protein
MDAVLTGAILDLSSLKEVNFRLRHSTPLTDFLED